MKTIWKAAAIVVVVIIMVIAAAAALGSGSDDSPEVRYDYSIEVSDSFAEADGGVVNAPAGSTFAIVTWRVANDGYADGFSTNDLIFQTDAVVNGVAHGTSIWGTTHPGHMLGEITEGSTASFVCVYEVPAGTTAQDVTMQMEYVMFDPPTMERDDSLL